MPVGRARLFAYHCRPGAFERLAPPWERIGIIRQTGTVSDGGQLSFRIHRGPFHLTWTAVHEAFREGRQFVDTQIKGPFRYWSHLHRFLDNGSNSSILEDTVDWALPLHELAYPLMGRTFDRSLERLFRFRHRRTHHDLRRFAAKPGPDVGPVIFAGRSAAFTHRLACFLSLAGLDIFRLGHEPGKTIRNLSFRPYFGAGKSHPLAPNAVVIFTEPPVTPRDRAQEWEIAELDFLCRAFATQDTGRSLLIRLHLPRISLDHYTTHPALEFGGNPDKSAMRDELAGVHERFTNAFEREAHFHFGCLIQAPIGYLVQLLLRMETYLFLGEGALTPRFAWISQDDALGAVYHLLHRPGLKGQLALATPSLASRAELQELLIKRNFFNYTLQRILKVLPWSAPGRPPGLAAELAEMDQLADTGFSFLTPELSLALGHELGELIAPPDVPG